MTKISKIEESLLEAMEEAIKLKKLDDTLTILAILERITIFKLKKVSV